MNEFLLFFTPLLLLNYFLFNGFLFLQKSGGKPPQPLPLEGSWVPCQWNQLCIKFTESDDFEKYRNCPKPIHAYHGNCKAKMPSIDHPHQFEAWKVKPSH